MATRPTRRSSGAMRRTCCSSAKRRGPWCAAAISQLPEAYRTVLLLRDIEGLETDETARLLGVTTGVIKTRLHRARQAVRKLLDPHLRAGAV